MLSSCLTMNQTIWKGKQLEIKMTATQRSPKRKVGIKVSWRRSCREKVNVGCMLHVAVCGAEGKDALSHADEDESQWDRNWITVLFIHGQPSLKVLFPEKHTQIQKHTDSEIQTHPSRHGDKYMHFSILQSALFSHSNSVASRDFENKICSFYHLKYIYFSS